MEFRPLVISQNNSSNKYIFNNKVNLVTSTSLSDDLLKSNYDTTNSNYVIESEGSISISEVFQIKIRIAQTGTLVVNFLKDSVSESDKEKLLSEISLLKDNVTPTSETQKSKVSKVIDIVNKYRPIFVSYVTTGDFIFTKSTFEEIVKDKEIDFPLLILLNSFGFVDEPVDPKKRKHINKNQDKQKPVKEIKKADGKIDFVALLEPLKSIDFIFFGIFSLFIAFGLIISIFEIQNGEGIAAFLLILTLAFFITLNYATYKAKKDNEYFTYDLKRIWIPVLYIVIGLTLGIVIGYLITTFVVKAKEEVTISNSLTYGLSIPLSLVFSLGSLATPKPLSIIIEKIKSKKKK